jgi:hypothetical protein
MITTQRVIFTKSECNTIISIFKEKEINNKKKTIL